MTKTFTDLSPHHQLLDNEHWVLFLKSQKSSPSFLKTNFPSDFLKFISSAIKFIAEGTPENYIHLLFDFDFSLFNDLSIECWRDEFNYVDKININDEYFWLPPRRSQMDLFCPSSYPEFILKPLTPVLSETLKSLYISYLRYCISAKDRLRLYENVLMMYGKGGKHFSKKIFKVQPQIKPSSRRKLVEYVRLI